MRRELVVDSKPVVKFTAVSETDRMRVEKCIEEFRAATPHNNKTLCQMLSNEFAAGTLSSESLERLSVWCHTAQPPEGTSDAARSVARSLIGAVPQRLRDESGKRIAEYESALRSLALQIGSAVE